MGELLRKRRHSIRPSQRTIYGEKFRRRRRRKIYMEKLKLRKETWIEAASASCFLGTWQLQVVGGKVWYSAPFLHFLFSGTVVGA